MTDIRMFVPISFVSDNNIALLKYTDVQPIFEELLKAFMKLTYETADGLAKSLSADNTGYVYDALRTLERYGKVKCIVPGDRVTARFKVVEEGK